MTIRDLELTSDKKVLLRSFCSERPKSQRPQPEPVLRPALLILPGGYYAYHSEREGEPVALEFLHRGFQSFVLKYHVGKDSAFPAPLEDVGLALRYIRAHAEELMVDAGQIFLVGFSAGGHLALLYNSLSKEEWPPIRGVIAGYPVANTAPIFASGADFSQLGAMLQSYRETTDPIRNISPSMAPVFLFYMTDDEMIPPVLTNQYVQELLKARVSVESHLFSGGHGISIGAGLYNYSSSFRELVHPWVALAEDWMTAQMKR